MDASKQEKNTDLFFFLKKLFQKKNFFEKTFFEKTPPSTPPLLLPLP